MFPLVTLIIALVALGVALFLAGMEYGSKLAVLPPVKTPRRGSVDPYAHIPHTPEMVPRTGADD